MYAAASHADEPPGHANRERMRTGDGFGEGDVAVSACGGKHITGEAWP